MFEYGFLHAAKEQKSMIAHQSALSTLLMPFQDLVISCTFDYVCIVAIECSFFYLGFHTKLPQFTSDIHDVNMNETIFDMLIRPSVV